MSLLDNAKKDVAKEAPATAVKTGAKKSNSEYQKKQREHQLAAATKIRDFINSKIKDVPEDIKEELSFLCRERKAAASSQFGTPVIYTLFGNEPKVGSKVSAIDAFTKTGKGFPEMRSQMKKWAAKGIVVEYDTASKSYVIKSGTIPVNTTAAQ